jgi:hypothetical protein
MSLGQVSFGAVRVLALAATTVCAEPVRPAELAWFAEGEACTDHNWSAPILTNADYAGCYGGGHLMCAMDGDPADRAYEARFEAEVPADGTYVLWIAATRPGVASALQVSVDGAAPVPVQAGSSLGMWGPSNVFSWMPSARVGLKAGKHAVTVGVTARREGDNRYYAYLDALGLELLGGDALLAFGSWPVMPNISSAETRIRFYSGNASVGWFMQYWGTAAAGGPTDAIDQPAIDRLQRCGCQAMCDYLAWCRIEESAGQWDWSFYRENARKLHAAGIQYSVFAWLHFPPRWFMETPDFVPYRCLEHGEDLQQLSLWAPATLRIYDEFYGRLARDLGEPVDFVRLAMPSEYGEIGYATGMTNWLVPQKHVHGGFWCGDPCARQDFREKMRARFVTLEALNERWGTAFAAWEDVAAPADPPGAAQAALDSRRPQDRRRWLDFVDWYQDAWGDFATAGTRIVQGHFPGKEIILSLGYGAEPVSWGNDQSRHVKRMAEVGAAAQTPGDIGYFATRRVSTACRAHGVPYFTEPPGGVDRQRQARRLFYDISNGTQTWFDYPGNMDGARDLLAENIDNLSGQPPVCDVAYLMPSSWWWCHPQWQWPERTIQFSEMLRDRMDYEVVDELLVREGALRKLGIRVLVACEGDFMQAGTLQALAEWVRGGGVLALMGVESLEDLDGDTSVFRALAPEAASDGQDTGRVWAAGRAVGAGHVVAMRGSDAAATAAQQAVTLDLTYRLADLDPARRNALRVEEDVDGIVSTVFADRVLLFNDTDHVVQKTLNFRAGDFPAGKPRPPQWEMHLAIPAHRSVCVKLGE